MPVATTTPRPRPCATRVPFVGEVVTIAERQVGLLQCTHVLLHGVRLAGQGRLLDPQLGGLDQAQVGSHGIAGLQHHHVAGHQLARRHTGGLPVAQHVCGGRRHGLESGDGALGAKGLDEADDRVEHNDHHDHHGIGEIADHARDHSRREQHQDHEVGELLEQQAPGPAAGAFLDLVGAGALQALRSLGAAQPPVGIAAQALQHLVGREQMPGCGLIAMGA